MSCDEMLRWVEEVVDGEATSDVRERVAAHLPACKDCREHDAEIRALDQAIGDARPDAPPESYWDELPARVLSRVEAEGLGAPAATARASRALSPTALPYVALAASVAVVMVAAALYQSGTGPEPSPALSHDEPRASRREPARAPSQSPARIDDGCDELRTALGRPPAGPSGVRDLRYELARCAVRAHAQEPSEASRRVAERETRSFLSLEPEGPRASEVRDLQASLEPEVP